MREGLAVLGSRRGGGIERLEGVAVATMQDDIESCGEQKNSVIFHLYVNLACYTN